MAGTSISFDIIARDMASAKLDRVGRAADQSAGPIGRLGRSMGSIAKTYGPLAAAAAGAFAVKFGVEAVNAASDAQQSIGATETVFKEFADTVIKESETAADKFGLSADEYRQNANLIGSLFKNQGVEMDELAGKTDDMIGVASDLAATFGGDTKDAVEALGSAFKGEFDPLEKYGISLKQSGINAEAAKLAQDKYGKSLDDLSPKQQAAMKQQATVEELYRQSADSAGQFARESDTLAGSQQRLRAKFDNLKVALGDKLLPIATDFTEWLAEDGIPLAEEFGGAVNDEVVVPLKDLGAAFQQAKSDAEPFFKLFGKDGASADMGALFDFFSMGKETLGVFSAALRGAGRALGKVGDAGRELWNRGLRPAFQFILGGVAGIAEGFESMFRAMSNVPGFGWAKKAANEMGEAALAARNISQNIRDIPREWSTNYELRTHYSYTGTPPPTKGGPIDPAGRPTGGSSGRSVGGPSQRVMDSVSRSAGMSPRDFAALLSSGVQITLVDGDAGRRAIMSAPGVI